MKSLGTRIAVVISSVLLCLLVVTGVLLERQLTQAIQDQGFEQAEVHAQTILGSLKTLMLNGNGTLAREWLDRLHGVAGIKDIEVLRRDGNAAFTDLNTVNSVNNYIGRPVFERQAVVAKHDASGISSEALGQALQGNTVHDFSQPGQLTIAMPIHADAECLSCHGYDSNSTRGILKLSLSTEATENRIEAMKNTLWGGAFLLAIVLAAILWYAMRLNVLRPIAILHQAILRVSEGDRAASVPIVRRDEIGNLGEVFNHMQAALRVSEDKIRAVMDNVVDGIVTMTENGTIESVNPALRQIFGYGEQELIGKNITVLSPAAHHDSEESILGKRYNGSGLQPILGLAREISGLRKNGTVFPMDVAVSEMWLGNQRFFIGIVRDITARKARTAALRYQALHDGLTDLPNRTLLMDRLQQSLLAAEREKDQISLILLDLDRFKEVNDTLGHHVGDKLLQQVAQRLRLVLRESDTVARLGGDEFCLLLPNADTTQAMFIARKVLNSIERPINVEGQNLSVGASLGIAVYPEHGSNAVVLLQRADVAMYVAKRGNRGYSVYDAQTDQHSLRQLALTSELRAAIEQNELVLFYQPNLDLKDKRVVGFEALVRWPHPKHGLLSPDEFVPLAEQTGLINALTLWVLDKALEECDKFAKLGMDVRIAVNLSMRNLSDLSFTDQIGKLLSQHNYSSNRLKLEITETALMEFPQRAIKALDRLNAMGLRLSIDDFGTGYSSLSYLKQLPVNEIKIDKSFGLSLSSDANSEVIVRSTIDLAHKLGLQVVAEGIETKESFDLLRQLGCDTAQGFYVGRPMSMGDVMSWMEARVGDEAAM